MVGKSDGPVFNLCYQKTKEHLAEVNERFPRQFGYERAQGFYWPDGWHGIVVDVCEQMQAKADGLQWEQIKEKFGGLRMYYVDGPIPVDNVLTRTTEAMLSGDGHFNHIADPILALAQVRSLSTCMGCGGPGSQRVKSGLVLTLCHQCLFWHVL